MRGKVDREEGEEGVAVGDRAGVVDGDEPVCVPSKASPRSAPPATTALATLSGLVEPQPSLMLAPSGSHEMAVTRAPRERKTPGRRRSSPVCAVEDDVESIEPTPLQRGLEVDPVLVGPALVNRDAADAVTGWGRLRWAVRVGQDRVHGRLDRRLGGEGSLEPPVPKTLMPLSAKGLCEADTTAAGSSRAHPGRRHPGWG